MSLKKRKFSLDSSVGLDGVGPIGGRRGSWRRGRPQQSLDEAREHIQELSHNLCTNIFQRENSIAEESVEGTDVNSNILKQHKSFRKLFPELPDGEGLTHAFTCALQKDGLYQGKLFIAASHVCFHSSVLLKETKVIVPFSSVREVKKHHSAMSLSIQSADGEKYLFVSLMNRGMCYKLLQSACSHALAESTNSSPHVSSGENELDFDVMSSNSSMEDSFDNDPSRKSSINHDHFPQLCSEVDARLNPQSQNIAMDEGDNRRWVRRVANWITSVFFVGETRNIQVLFHAYILLMLLLLLVSGYIGLRIIALEEHLTSLGSVAPTSQHTHYKET